MVCSVPTPRLAETLLQLPVWCSCGHAGSRFPDVASRFWSASPGRDPAPHLSSQELTALWLFL